MVVQYLHQVDKIQYLGAHIRSDLNWAIVLTNMSPTRKMCRGEQRVLWPTTNPENQVVWQVPWKSQLEASGYAKKHAASFICIEL